MAIQTVADLVARSTTSSPTVTSGQYRQERENVMASIGLEKAKPPVAAVSANPPKMYFEQAQTSVPEVKPQGQGQSPFSGSNIAPPRTDYATGISDAERSRTATGRTVTAEDRTNDVLGLVRQGLTNPQELQRYLNVNQAGGVASGYTEAEIARIIKENQKAVTEGQQYRQQAIAGGATPQTLEQQALQAVKDAEDQRKTSFNVQQEYLNRQFQSQYNARELAQKSEAGQSNLRLARMGAFEAKSGESYEASLNTRHKSELFDIETKRMAALNAAQNAYDKDSLEIAYKKLEEVRALGDQMIKKDAENRAKEKEAREIQKYEKEDLAATFEGMIEDGVDVSVIPDDYLKLKYPNLTRTDVTSLFNTVKRKRALDDAKTEKEKADIAKDSVSDLWDLLSKVPLGQSQKIGDTVYFGTKGADKIEIDEDGFGRSITVDQKTGKLEVKDLGRIGRASPESYSVQYNELTGEPYVFNARTGQFTSASSKPKLKDTFSRYYPEGSTPENGRGQCAEWVNDLTGLKMGDSLQSKITAMDKGLSASDVMAGDVFVMETGQPYGHTGFISDKSILPNGKIQFTLSESNWNGDENVTHTRTMLSDDPRFKGFKRVNLPPQLSSESATSSGPRKATQAEKDAKKTEGQKDDTESLAISLVGGDIEITGVPSAQKAKVLARARELRAEKAKEFISQKEQESGQSFSPAKKKQLEAEFNKTNKNAFESTLGREKNDKYLNDANKLADDYRGESKDFITQRNAFQNSQSINVNTSNPQDDISLIYSFMKVVDPTSVVRETEFNTAAKASSFLDQFNIKVGKVAGGQLLNPTIRQQIKDTLGTRFENADKNQKSIVRQYTTRAKGFRIDPEDVITDYTLEDTSAPSSTETSSELSNLRSKYNY